MNKEGQRVEERVFTVTFSRVTTKPSSSSCFVRKSATKQDSIYLELNYVQVQCTVCSTMYMYMYVYTYIHVYSENYSL